MASIIEKTSEPSNFSNLIVKIPYRKLEEADIIVINVIINLNFKLKLVK